MPDGPTVIPEEARTLERAVHAIAEDLGFNIAGIARLDDIGYTGDRATRVTLTIPIGDDGKPTHLDGVSSTRSCRSMRCGCPWAVPPRSGCNSSAAGGLPIFPGRGGGGCHLGSSSLLESVAR